ncbi:hypothetical protein NPIL_396861 [Nephila pilipes]|uniref:Uncharacterized protein n=1 Tax=Nephila pilipes TaxID=299642 RepID=A0A8X6Q627_NEPPI|nr:hypothetical protein NPIL_396861 [Nephila pilipes]
MSFVQNIANLSLNSSPMWGLCVRIPSKPLKRSAKSNHLYESLRFPLSPIFCLPKEGNEANRAAGSEKHIFDSKIFWNRVSGSSAGREIVLLNQVSGLSDLGRDSEQKPL